MKGLYFSLTPPHESKQMGIFTQKRKVRMLKWKNQYGKGSVVYLILANQQPQRGLEETCMCSPPPLPVAKPLC